LVLPSGVDDLDTAHRKRLGRSQPLGYAAPMRTRINAHDLPCPTLFQ
jgi:hypothetical protein